MLHADTPDADPIHARLSHRSGFTLVELLVAITIIIILAALTIGVGSSVANSGRQRSTEGALQALDQMLEAYVQSVGDNPPAFVKIDEVDLPEDGLVSNEPAYFPLFDGVVVGDEQVINTVGLFLSEAQRVASVQDLIAGLDAKFIRLYQPGEAGSRIQPELLTVFDAWGNPIRMVHPRFDGQLVDNERNPGDPGDFIDLTDDRSAFVQGVESTWAAAGQFGVEEVRRNALVKADRELDPELLGDSDGGICPGPRPYFYSAGPDGDPSTIEDNIYTATPRFQS